MASDGTGKIDLRFFEIDLDNIPLFLLSNDFDSYLQNYNLNLYCFSLQFDYATFSFLPLALYTQVETFFLSLCSEYIGELRLEIKPETLTTHVLVLYVLGSLFLLCQLGLPIVDGPSTLSAPSTMVSRVKTRLLSYFVSRLFDRLVDIRSRMDLSIPNWHPSLNSIN